MTSGTDMDNEMRCAAAVRSALGDAYGTPAQAALRFVLGNQDFAARVIGITDLPSSTPRSRPWRRGRCRRRRSPSSRRCGPTNSG